MPFVDFDALELQAMAPAHSRARGAVVTGTQLQMSRVRFAAGEGADYHSHPHEQMIYVLAGRLRVTSGAQERELTPGQGAWHPPGVRHRVHAVEATELISVKPAA